VGITFVYWIISLHSAPYPYPQNITVSREDLFGKIKPNGIFISVQDDWVYLTAIWKEHEVNYEDATGKFLIMKCLVICKDYFNERITCITKIYFNKCIKNYLHFFFRA